MFAFRSTQQSLPTPADSIQQEPFRRRRSGSTGRRLPNNSAIHVEIFRDATGNIVNVQIGRWRVTSANGQRRIAEVRELVCRRIAVRVELDDRRQLTPSCTIWELYDAAGHLLCMLQRSRENDRWTATNFQTGKVSQVIDNEVAGPGPREVTSR